MEKGELTALVSQNLSIREIATEAGLSPTAIRYWLRKHNLKVVRGPHGKKEGIESFYRCRTCGTTEISKFYRTKRNICGACHNAYTIRRGKEKRRYAILKLGGKCIICHFDKYECALEIHHKDPSKKDPNFNSMRGWSYNRIDKELISCTLLCKNCHSAVHNGDIENSECGAVWKRT